MRPPERNLHHREPGAPARPRGGSNEIFRLPVRGYFSSDGGASWGGVDLPLPPAKGNGVNFGSDPTLAFDSSGNVYYGCIVVYVGNGNGINGTAMAIARSTDGGRTYPQFTVFSLECGENHFNDHRRQQPGEPVPRLRLRGLGRRGRRLQRRRRPLRALHRRRQDVHDHARRRSAGTGPGDRRDPVRRIER